MLLVVTGAHVDWVGPLRRRSDLQRATSTSIACFRAHGADNANARIIALAGAKPGEDVGSTVLGNGNKLIGGKVAWVRPEEVSPRLPFRKRRSEL